MASKGFNNYDTWLTAPLRRKHAEEEFREYWDERCREYLQDLGYTEWMIEALEETINKKIETMRRNPPNECGGNDAEELIGAAHEGKELEEILFFHCVEQGEKVINNNT